jgi:hypothetical protein
MTDKWACSPWSYVDTRGAEASGWYYYPTKRRENGVKSYPQLDCVELERHIFPVLHMTLGLANRLIKHTIN